MRAISRRDFLSLGRSCEADPIVHIASLLIQATEAGCAAIRGAIDSLPGAELHETGQPGKLAVVLESVDSRAIADAATALQQLSGVFTVSIVAHLTESASALEQPHDEPTTIPAA
jgi:nitrate reductase NapAB chaperone NapD